MKTKFWNEKRLEIKQFLFFVKTGIVLFFGVIFGFEFLKRSYPTPFQSRKPAVAAIVENSNSVGFRKNVTSNDTLVQQSWGSKKISQGISLIELENFIMQKNLNHMCQAIFAAQQNPQFVQKMANFASQNQKNVVNFEQNSDIGNVPLKTPSLEKSSQKNLQVLVAVGPTIEFMDKLEVKVVTDAQREAQVKELFLNFKAKLTNLVDENFIPEFLVGETAESFERLAEFITNFVNRALFPGIQNAPIREFRLSGEFDPNLPNNRFSGLSVIRQNETQYNLTVVRLHQFATRAARAQNANPDDFFVVLETLILDFHRLRDSLNIQDIQNRKVNSFLRDSQEVVESVTANNLTLPSSLVKQKSLGVTKTFTNCQLYVKNIPLFPGDASFSFNLASRDLFMGAGKSFFTPVVKNNVGIIVGVDGGVRFRYQSNSFFNYSYGGLAARVFAGVGVSAIF